MKTGNMIAYRSLPEADQEKITGLVVIGTACIAPSAGNEDMVCVRSCVATLHNYPRFRQRFLSLTILNYSALPVLQSWI